MYPGFPGFHSSELAIFITPIAAHCSEYRPFSPFQINSNLRGCFVLKNNALLVLASLIICDVT